MAALTQNLSINLISTSTPNPTSIKTHQNSPLKISKFPQKPPKTSSLKELCHQENLKEAFTSLSKIITKNQNPPRKNLDEAYSLLLELCATQNALSQAKQIHTHVLKSQAVCDTVFLNTKLVFIYGKIGSLLYAKKLFDEMPEITVYSWNAMIGGYVTHGEFFKALELYKDMRLLNFPLDAHSFSCILKACGVVEDLCIGSEIHGLAIKLGFVDNNVFVVNSLVGMYAKCDDINATVMLFDRLIDKRDVVSWNSIISAYVANGMPIEALRLFNEMCNAGVIPSTYTFVAVLQACEEPEFGKVGMAIHAILLKLGYYLDVYVANALLVMYARITMVDEAERIFWETDEKDNVSWNSMLSGYVQNCLYDEANDLFCAMMSVGQKPDEVSVISVLAACGRSGNLDSGMKIHAFALKNGMGWDLQVGNSLIDMYAKCGRMDFVDFIFDRMGCKDYISWTTTIAGYAQNNFHRKALQLFHEVLREGIDVDELMIGSILLACTGLKCDSLVKEIHGYVMRRGFSDILIQNSFVNVYGDCGYIDYARRIFKLIENKNIVSFTSMISCYVNNGLASEALDLVINMKETGIELDYVAVLSILSAAGDLSALRKGKEIHGFLTRRGFIIQGSIASSLVDMYASCGTIENSHKVFSCTKNKDLIMWTSMINACGMHGFGKAAIDLFRRMQGVNLVPDHITFLALLNACSHSALVDEGKMFFEIMQCEYKLEPWPEHYACLVDMLGRANKLEEAFQFVERMKMEPTKSVWSALLGACRIHCNKELGDIAARKLLELDPNNPGNYVLVSNIYAEAGRWEDVEEVRLTMKVKGLKKDPACSWIQVGNRVHTFIAHDKSHPESDNIYQKLAQITEKLEKEGGYVAQTKYVLHNVEEKQKAKMLHGHSERLAIACGLLSSSDGTPIRIMKNLRVCGDCHTFIKQASQLLDREIIVRDAKRFHHFKDGFCSCKDFW